MLDSGTGLDLTDRKDVPPANMETLKPCDEPCFLETANGITPADQTVTMQIPTLMEEVEAIPIDGPDVLSLGRRCAKMGYEFHWKPFAKTPELFTPKSRGRQRIETFVTDYVPYIADTDNITKHARQRSTLVPRHRSRDRSLTSRNRKASPSTVQRFLDARAGINNVVLVPGSVVGTSPSRSALPGPSEACLTDGSDVDARVLGKWPGRAVKVLNKPIHVPYVERGP